MEQKEELIKIIRNAPNKCRPFNLYRANLSEADLSEANLYRANLSEANLSGTEIILFQFQQHFAYFQSSTKMLKIGCHDHLLDNWLEDYQQIGLKNDYTELQIKIYHQFIMLCQKIVEDA